MPRKKIFAGPSIRRLPSYLYIVKAALAHGDEYISGTVIADELQLEAIQVRKDLSLTGVMGKPKRGYAIQELITSIESFLGWNVEKSAALVGAEKAKQDSHHTGKEEYNYFMAVCFQASQLTILDYNRVVKDLNGMTSDQFLEALSKNFVISCKGKDNYKPTKLHEFSLYIDGKWYSLIAKEGTYDDTNPIGVLDVDISSRLILDELLGIKDLRSDERIDFVGGLRGLGELKRRVDDGEMRMALALYPVTMKQIMDIADSGKIMPPKATWFEPKLRSGLVIHKLS